MYCDPVQSSVAAPASCPRSAQPCRRWVTLLPVTEADAQTDEIQVYDTEINNPGVLSLQLHNNYIPIGRERPDFIVGIAPNHTSNGVPEWAWGITDWLELGAYAAVYSWAGDGRFLIDGAEFVVPHAAERSFFYGVDFELGCNARYWGTDPPSGEIRPIIGGRLGPVDPILGTSSKVWVRLTSHRRRGSPITFPKLGQQRWNTMPITVASTSLSLWAGSSSSSSRSSTIRALRYTSNWGSATASRRLQTVWCSN
jgi:hypothetical protein